MARRVGVNGVPVITIALTMIDKHVESAPVLKV